MQMISRMRAEQWSEKTGVRGADEMTCQGTLSQFCRVNPSEGYIPKDVVVNREAAFIGTWSPIETSSMQDLVFSLCREGYNGDMWTQDGIAPSAGESGLDVKSSLVPGTTSFCNNHHEESIPVTVVKQHTAEWIEVPGFIHGKEAPRAHLGPRDTVSGDEATDVEGTCEAHSLHVVEDDGEISEADRKWNTRWKWK